MWLPDIIHQIDVLPIYAIYKNMHMAAKLDVEIADQKRCNRNEGAPRLLELRHR